jgi:hypothetical protein
MYEMIKDLIPYLSDIKQIVEDSNDWRLVKRELIKNLPSPMRVGFSRRDKKTYQMVLNDFEREIMRYWFDTYGIELILLWKDVPSRPSKNPPEDKRIR